MANRRKHTNAVPVAALAKSIVVAFFLGVLGLCFVYFKNQQHATCSQIRLLEKELASLVNQNEAAASRIALLSSRSMLQKRVAEGMIKMVPISGDKIVRVNLGEVVGDELRAVVNEGVGK